jgi:hypothetical protein
MSEVPLSEHDNVVKALPSDRTHQPLVPYPAVSLVSINPAGSHNQFDLLRVYSGSLFMVAISGQWGL